MLARICPLVCANLNDSLVGAQSMTCLWPGPRLQPESGKVQLEKHLTCARDLMFDPWGCRAKPKWHSWCVDMLPPKSRNVAASSGSFQESLLGPKMK